MLASALALAFSSNAFAGVTISTPVVNANIGSGVTIEVGGGATNVNTVHAYLEKWDGGTNTWVQVVTGVNLAVNTGYWTTNPPPPDPVTSFQPPTGGWPTGQYRAVAYDVLNSSDVATVEFNIVGGGGEEEPPDGE